jgi:membrane protease YdiL (CAAX protease family)
MMHLLLIITSLTCYLIYHLIATSGRIDAALLRVFPRAELSIIKVIFQRAGGVICLGLFPALVAYIAPVRLHEYGLSWRLDGDSALWSLGLGAVLISMNYFAGKNPDTWEHAPHIRKNDWSFSTIAINSLSWIGYLFAYEFMFRGVLLYASYAAAGYWPAVLLNTAVYSLVHIPKGARQAVGAIPFGIVLCVLTFHTGAIWIAFFAHVFLALSHDHFSIIHNPEKVYSFGKSRGRTR